MLSKLSINSMLGLWARDDACTYRLYTSRSEQDAPKGSLKRVFQWDGGSVEDYILGTPTIGSLIHRPLSDLVLSSEAVRVGQMIYHLKQCGCILTVRV